MTETTRPTEITETDLDQAQGGGESEFRYVPVRRFAASTSTTKDKSNPAQDGSADGYTATDDLWK